MANNNDLSLPFASRRSFLSLSAAASAALAFRIVTEPMLAHARVHNFPKDAIRIDANENPLGPGASAREAAAAIVPQGGRYSDWLTDDLVKTLAEVEGLKLEQVRVYAGSSEPLHHTVAAFASPQRSYVTADPGYEAGMFAANAVGAVVLVDEAYIHFADAVSVMDLVKAGKDVILLRTFSKIYGMAGLRCGAVFGRPDLLEKIEHYGGWNFMPITALVAASASLKDAQLVPERKRINARIRGEVFAWLDRNGYSYVPSESNCFMLDTKRPAKAAIDAMAQQNIFIGRIWPVWPTYARITIGTAPEMEQFQAAWQKVMSGSVTASVGAMPSAGELGRRKRNLDGIVMRG